MRGFFTRKGFQQRFLFLKKISNWASSANIDQKREATSKRVTKIKWQSCRHVLLNWPVFGSTLEIINSPLEANFLKLFDFLRSLIWHKTILWLGDFEIIANAKERRKKSLLDLFGIRDPKLSNLSWNAREKNVNRLVVRPRQSCINFRRFNFKQNFGQISC